MAWAISTRARRLPPNWADIRDQVRDRAAGRCQAHHHAPPNPHPGDTMTRPRRRNTTTRDLHRATIARTEPPCGICGDPIDYTLPWTDPAAYVVDHIVPIAAGGTDALTNKQAAHRDCNRQKGAKPHADTIKRSGSLARPNQR